VALIVEDGTGLATAESYVSVAYVDTYATNIGDATWATLTTAQQEQACRKATRYMEAKWRLRWKGNKTLETQALAWPRYNVLDEDGYVVDSDDVPQAVEHACSEAALLAGASVDLEPDVSRIKKSVRAGSVEVEWFPGSDPYTVRTKVLGKIEHLLELSMKIARSA
jgi:Putative DnaT-like ssDNA binding protein